MQPYHAIDDGRWADKVIGAERAKGTYAFRSLLDAGARVAFGSDWFVAPPVPLEGIQAAVTRQTLDGRHPGGWVPEQKIRVEEALRAYTAGSAYAGFADADLGRLERGRLADFVLIDRDLTHVPLESIRDARVMMTIVGGRVVYERTDAPPREEPSTRQAPLQESEQLRINVPSGARVAGRRVLLRQGGETRVFVAGISFLDNAVQATAFGLKRCQARSSSADFSS